MTNAHSLPLPSRRLRRTLAAGASALLLAGSLTTLTGCGNDNNATPAGVIRVYGSEPQHPLIPTNTNEVGGGDILLYLFSGLIRYDNDGKMVLAHAKSIKANSNSTKFTITLKPGWTFSNGEPVTAQSYVDAWNYGACGKNMQLNQSFFSTIDGYEDVIPEDNTDCHMRGLTVTSPLSFTVTLNQPEAGFPLRLGHIPYMPLPRIAYKDIKSFGEHPIGNGPYKLVDGKAWLHNDRVLAEVNPRYKGDLTPHNKSIWWIFYTSLDTAYADLLGGQLDTIGNTVGSTALPNFQTDFPTSYNNKPTASSSAFVIPEWLPHFQGEEGRLRRAAISMSINRPLITDKIFFGTRTPAKEFTSPTLGDVDLNVPGNDVLTYNPDKARKLWKQANSIKPWNDTFQIGYNADGGNQQWVDAVCNNLHQVLGITAYGKAYPTFKQFRDEITQRTIKIAFRSGWAGDYPSVYNFLQPLYMTGASSNDGNYSSPAFDKLISQAAAASSINESKKFYRKAQAILMRDLPAIPLWYPNASTAWNPELKGVHIMWNGYPNYTLIEKPTPVKEK